MWFFILGGMMLAALAGFAYVVSRLTKFGWLRRFPKKTALLISTSVLLGILLLLTAWGGLWNAMIVFIHLMLFWLLCDGAAALIRRPARRYWAGYAAIGITVLYLGMGYFFAHHVFRTEYRVNLPMDAQSLRIVGFSDSHVGTTFHGEKLEEYVARMNGENPDIVVIPGDFVDDGTSYEDMARSCQALSSLRAKYGVYFVFGNHDCGYSNARGYGKAELVAELERAGVIVLEDETVPIAGNLYLCGRQDSQQKSRASMASLMEGLPEGSCVIVLDHEPNDQYAEAAAGTALVLSGHTHGGQFFPILKAGEWIGANDMTYGFRMLNNTRFIVSSGIADWAFQFKTGCISEYFVIDAEQ